MAASPEGEPGGANMAASPNAGAGAGVEGVEQEQSTFDIFVQSIDLRWCLLLRWLRLCFAHCNSATLLCVSAACAGQGLKQPYQLALTPSMEAIRAGCHHAQRLDDGFHHGLAEAATS